MSGGRITGLILAITGFAASAAGIAWQAIHADGYVRLYGMLSADPSAIADVPLRATAVMAAPITGTIILVVGIVLTAACGRNRPNRKGKHSR